MANSLFRISLHDFYLDSLICCITTHRWDRFFCLNAGISWNTWTQKHPCGKQTSPREAWLRVRPLVPPRACMAAVVYVSTNKQMCLQALQRLHDDSTEMQQAYHLSPDWDWICALIKTKKWHFFPVFFPLPSFLMNIKAMAAMLPPPPQQKNYSPVIVFALPVIGSILVAVFIALSAPAWL